MGKQYYNGIKLDVVFKKINFDNDEYDYFMNISKVAHLIMPKKKILDKRLSEILVENPEDVLLINNEYWMSYDGFSSFLLKFRKFDTSKVSAIIGKYENKKHKIKNPRTKEILKPYPFDIINKQKGIYISLDQLSDFLNCPLERMVNKSKELKNNNDILIYANDYVIVNKNGFNYLVNSLNFKKTNKEVIYINDYFDRVMR